MNQRKTPKVLLFFPSFQPGGMERVMLNLAGAFRQEGLEVVLLVLRDEGPFREQVPPGMRVIALGGDNLYASLLKVIGALRRERPDAMLAGSVNANVTALLANRLSGVRARVVISEHSRFKARESKSSRRLSVRLRERLRGLFYPWAGAISAVSAGVADSIAETGVERERIQVIYNPVFSPELALRALEAPGHPWLEERKTPVVLAVGRLAAAKDYSTLLRGFALLRSRRAGKLVILGEGPERARLEALAAELGIKQDVSMPGFHPNPYACMARASVLALTSAWEGFANVLVEALACGTPVVATDCESGPREILEGGRYGRLVSVGDAAALANALEQALDAPVDADLLRQRAECFSVEEAAKRYLALLLPNYTGGGA